MNDDWEWITPEMDEEDYTPPVRGRSRRDRLNDAMTEKQLRKKNSRRDHVSKPKKNFKHNRRRNQKDGR